MENLLKKILSDSISIKLKLQDPEYVKTFDQISEILFQSIINKGKILICGNGGSAADAQHIVAELLIRFRSNINRDPIPAIALTMDTSTLTACGNDLGYEYLFQRNVQALGNKNDVLLCISTSGMSKNIYLAAESAKSIGMKIIGLLGNGGGVIKKNCDFSLVVPSNNTARIQECHILIGHALVELLEDKLLERGMLVKQMIRLGKTK